jgi:hypothetical protein
MQLCMAHHLVVSDFDIFKTQQEVAQKHRFWTNNDCIFKATCGVVKISNIGDHQKMRHAKLHISHTKLKIL